MEEWEQERWRREGGGGGGGGRGGDSGNDDNDNGDKERNKEEAVMALLEAGRSVETVPKDFAAAIEAGRVPGSIVKRYFELEKSVLFRWLLQFGGFKERLLADDLFLTKVAIECGVGIFTKVFALVSASSHCSTILFCLFVYPPMIDSSFLCSVLINYDLSQKAIRILVI